MASKIKITNKLQLERLVQLMEQNPEIGRGIGKFGSSKQQTGDMWAQFSVELNSMGPPTRTSTEWRRVWVHFKANLKRKLSKNKASISATGGGPSVEIPLTVEEERVCDSTNMNMSINPLGLAFGLDVIELYDDSTSPSASPIQSKAETGSPKPRMPKIKKTSVCQIDLLKKQIELQKDMLNIQKETLAVKKKKIALMQKNYEEEKVLRDINIEIARRKLEQLREMSVVEEKFEEEVMEEVEWLQ